MTQPGYPLPDGELGEDDLVCQLVYLPDRPEYWQAFLGALHYMTTWRAWERDSDKRGKDAAANWRAAFELTVECWRMACLQDLQDNVAEILAIMQMGQSCCDEQDITDGDRYTDRVEDGVGDVPQNIIDAGYAEDAADWDGFDDYKCMIAHVTVDQLSARTYELAKIVNEYGAVAGGLAAVAGIMGVIFSAGGVALVFGLLMGVGAVSLLYEALMGFPLLDDLGDKVVTNHDLLACVIYWADGDDAALSALNNKIDELFTVPEALILKNMNLGPTLKGLYAGRYDQQDIADELLSAGYELDDFDCECDEQIGEFRWEWDFSTEFGSFLVNQDNMDWNAGGWMEEQCNWCSPALWCTGSNLSDWAGGSPTGSIRIRRMGVSVISGQVGGNTTLRIHHNGVGTPYNYVDGLPITLELISVNLDEEGENLTTLYDDLVWFDFQLVNADWIEVHDVFIEFDLLP